MPSPIVKYNSKSVIATIEPNKKLFMLVEPVSYTHLDVYKRQLMETAGEGGAWGIALLASYMLTKAENETLTDFLNNKVFSQSESYTLEPTDEDVKGFNEFAVRYKNGLPIEKAAVEYLKY